MTDLVRLETDGLVGPDRRFHIDAWGKAGVNLITHAHGDHARPGSAEYWCAEDCAPLLHHRLGSGTPVRPMRYGERARLGDCWISFHPAGHIRGSAQIRIEQGSDVWVVTGDYKRDSDPTCEPFEPVACNTLVTEATFGLPIYHWSLSADTVESIMEWWEWCKQKRVTALLFCYALGKAQRILAELSRWTDEEVLVHGAVASLTNIYREQGVKMVPTRVVGESTDWRCRALGFSPAIGASQPLDETVSRRLDGIRLRVDGGARIQAATRLSTWIRAVGPCGLGGDSYGRLRSLVRHACS